MKTGFIHLCFIQVFISQYHRRRATRLLSSKYCLKPSECLVTWHQTLALYPEMDYCANMLATNFGRLRRDLLSSPQYLQAEYMICGGGWIVISARFNNAMALILCICCYPVPHYSCGCQHRTNQFLAKFWPVRKKHFSTSNIDPVRAIWKLRKSLKVLY